MAEIVLTLKTTLRTRRSFVRRAGSVASCRTQIWGTCRCGMRRREDPLRLGDLFSIEGSAPVPYT
jgi:hypothetical protein